MYGVRALYMKKAKAKAGRKAGTITRWHVLQLVKLTNIVNNST
jgi:hypothetical protein